MEAVRLNKPDLILLDILMPKMDGFVVLKELKKNIKTKNIPVVMLSNLAQDEEIKRALLLGAVDFLVKTQYSISDIVEKIQKYSFHNKKR